MKNTIKENKSISNNIKTFPFGLSNKNSIMQMRSLVKHGYTQTGGSCVVENQISTDNLKIYNAEFKIILSACSSNIIFRRSICELKEEATIPVINATTITPNTADIIAMNLPIAVIGAISPYPTVVKVIRAQYIEPGIDLKPVGCTWCSAK